ncbi:MAG: cell division protein FtsZ [Pseudomonadota bacterium]
MARELKPRIMVFGVGGAGGNAVDNMIDANLQGVEFVVANTDAQALGRSKTENRIQLGPETTAGLGAGARPDIGAASAEESIADIEEHLEGAHMIFIAAGMGGGTGTGAAPIIAKAAHDKGILTVGVVTKPFGFEGNRRMELAEEGLDKIRAHVDTLIVVPNQNLFRIANERTTFAEAFRLADDVLYSGVRGITDLMVMPGLINLDFADVQSIMKGMGSAMMGMAEAEGENRALEAAKAAIDNPLLDDVSMKGARGVLINITGGYDMTLFEVDEAANEVRAEVDPNATIILGSAFDPELDGKIRVSVVAAGIDAEYVVEQPVVPAVAATPAPASEAAPIAAAASDAERDGPVVVTRPEPSEPEQEPAIQHDPRPDFAGRPLPAAHVEATPGDEQVVADAVLSEEPEAEVGAKVPAPSDGSPGFASLFGWRRSAEGENDDTPEKPPARESIVSSPDDHPDAAPFDDEDLEIPAFLRRSANN